MRTAEELVSKLLSEMPYTVNANVVSYLIELVDVAQTEAWNEAIEAAAELAALEWDGMFDKHSILKLKK